jgi:hypothetical protein
VFTPQQKTARKEAYAPTFTPLQTLHQTLAQSRKTYLETHASQWLEALKVPLANINTFPTCVSLVCHDGSGSFDLMAADVGAVPEELKIMTAEERKGMFGRNGGQWMEFQTRLKAFQGMKIVEHVSVFITKLFTISKILTCY